MLRGFATLTWIELKIFLREPLGVIGTVAVPVALFVILGRLFAGDAQRSPAAERWTTISLPILVVLFVALGAVLSLTAIISIYREGGILKRLKATPLHPLTILGTHVAVKLVLSAATLALLVLAGRRLYSGELHVPWASFGVAVLVATLSILSIGFVLASVIPTARFAQPIGSVLLYVMLGLSGAFVPVASFPPGLQAVAWALPLTHAVSLLEGIWTGGAWGEQWIHVAALVANLAACSFLASKLFRWE
ncbi:MAG: ABC transporter permease [Thermoanaerobaculia bacterium]|nr:ABC transporter permease [Thermoanaerobaculia bacterium]